MGSQLSLGGQPPRRLRRRRSLPTALGFLLAIGLAAAAGAQTFTLPATADSYLKQGSPNQNQSGDSLLRLQSSGRNRVLIAVDPSAIASTVGGGRLVTAALELHVATNANNWGASGGTIDIHRVTAAWTEAGTTWNCPVDAIPGNSSADCLTQWGGGAFEEEPTDTVLHTNGLLGWIEFDVTADVAAYLAGTPADGWLIKKTDENQSGKVEYDSREGAAGLAPRLRLLVETTTDDVVPPSLAVTAPALPFVVNDPTPPIALAYSDGGSGLDLASLAVAVDGQDITAGCTVGGAAATCVSPALGAGPHAVTAQLADLAGNVAEASKGFEVLVGPGLQTASFPAVADTYLRSGSPNQNQGTDGFLRVRQSGKNRALVRFDDATVGAVLAGAEISMATLELFLETNGDNWGADGRAVGAHRLTADWSESAATWNCAADADLANQQPDCASQWAGGAFAPQPTASVLHTNGLGGLLAFDVTADVEAFLAGTPDHGWLLKKEDEGKSGLAEYTSREGAAGNAPRLTVIFSTPQTGDDQPPTVAIDQPAEGTFVADAQPTVVASYSDAGSGVDPASVRVAVDGTDRTVEAQVTAAQLTLTPADPLSDALHTVAVTVRDLAGNESTAAVSFTVDTTPPSLAVTSPPGPVVTEDPTPLIEVTYADASSGVDLSALRVFIGEVELTAGCAIGPSSASCEPPPLTAGGHSASAQLADQAGNLTATTSVFQLVFDTEPPTLAVVAPAGSLVVGDPTPTIRVEYSDDLTGVDPASLRVSLDGVDLSGCSAGSDAATCPSPPLGRGPHTVAAVLADLRGNQATASHDFAAVFPLDIAFTEPTAGTRLPMPYVHVEGTVSPTAQSVTVNGVAAEVLGGDFSIDQLGLHDGVNNLVAVAEDAAGNVGLATVRVTADTTAPEISLTYPSEGAFVFSPTLTVTGVVNDLTIGTVSETDVAVEVNGVAAQVSNRSFLAGGVPLAPGPNTLTAVATDLAGNRTTVEVHVTFDDHAGSPTIQRVSGDGQSAPIFTPSPSRCGSPCATSQATPSPASRSSSGWSKATASSPAASGWSRRPPTPRERRPRPSPSDAGPESASTGCAPPPWRSPARSSSRPRRCPDLRRWSTSSRGTPSTASSDPLCRSC